MSVLRKKRAANFGLLGAAFGFGFTAGPALGGIIADFGKNIYGDEFGIRLPFIVAGFLTLMNWLYGIFVLPESLKQENRKTFNFKYALSRFNPFTAILNLKHYPLVMGLAIAYFILSLGHQVFPATWALFTKEVFQWGPREIGMSLGLVGIMAIIVQGGLVRKIMPWLGERKATVYGTLINIFSLTLFGFVSSAGVVYAIIIGGALGGVATPAIQGLISKTVGDDEQGSIQELLPA